MQMVDITADAHEGNVMPWHHCHKGEVAAADINVDKQQVPPADYCAHYLFAEAETKPAASGNHVFAHGHVSKLTLTFVDMTPPGCKLLPQFQFRARNACWRLHLSNVCCMPWSY